jgi:hypothetical protein
MPHGGLGIDHERLLDVFVVYRRELLLCPKGLRGTHSRYNFLGERSAICDRPSAESRWYCQLDTHDITGAQETYCMYLLTALFMMPPVIAMQGRMAETARARRHDRMYATVARDT